MKTKRSMFLFLLVLLITAQTVQAGHPDIVPLRKRAEIINHWLKLRLERSLPELMRREKFDMWIVACREYNEDPVFKTLVPATSFAARRTTILVFYDNGKTVERIAVSRYGIGDYYEGVWNPDEMDQWSCLAKVIEAKKPKRIGINVSKTFAFGDGLSAGLKGLMEKAVDPKYTARMESAERLAVGWLETRTPEEMEVYHHIVGIAHQVIREFFSNQVITPGVTTTRDVVWWIRERFLNLGVSTWFQPSCSIQRDSRLKFNDTERDVIHRGDVLHCDIGITYLRLNTDTQENAYVLREGETDVPAGLKKVLSTGNRLQDILTDAYKEGRTGNDILLAALTKMKSEGIDGSIYTHPLGYHGHAAGPTIGLWDQQRAIPGRGDYPLYSHTCYAIELNAAEKVPEWGGQEVRLGLEQDAVYYKDRGVIYIDGRQTEFHIIH